MQKLARIEPAPKPQAVYVHPIKSSTCFTIIYSNKPNIPQAMQSRSVLLKNMFDPEE
jgi:RNA-binding protein 39